MFCYFYFTWKKIVTLFLFLRLWLCSCIAAVLNLEYTYPGGMQVALGGTQNAKF
jgi:hypothetical protein